MRLKYTDDLKDLQDTVFTRFHISFKICCLLFRCLPLLLVVCLTT